MAAPTPLPKASTITLPELQATLALYKPLLMHLTMEDVRKVQKTGGVLGEVLHLDRQRYESLPGLQNRTSMTKKEVTWAMDWKLKHGTNRPSLPALLAQNSEEVVESTTKSAFALYNSDPANYAAPLKKLAELKGVGPATASLLLSIYDLDNAPFFSDELFRWVCWDEGQGGWKRKIKYDMKEYGMLWDEVKSLRERLGDGVKAVELEKCAFVCGRLEVDGKLEAEIRAEAEKDKAEEEATSSINQPMSEPKEHPVSAPPPAAKNAKGTKAGSAPPPAKNAKGNKGETKTTKKYSKRSSTDAELDSASDKASASSSPRKKSKRENGKTATAEKPAKKSPPTETSKSSAAEKGPAPAKKSATKTSTTKSSTKSRTKAKEDAAPSKPNGGENGRVLRPRKEKTNEN